MALIVYNRLTEDHALHPNNFYIGRGSVLGNPYTDINDRQTKASYIVSSREEAIEKYNEYFDIMYGSNVFFTKAIDKIYEAYKRGEDVYLECYCKPKPCHGDVIVKKLKQRFIKEKLNERQNGS